MKNNVLWLIAGAFVAYLLIPKQIKETILPSGGLGLGGIKFPDISFPDITFPDIRYPDIFAFFRDGKGTENETETTNLIDDLADVVAEGRETFLETPIDVVRDFLEEQRVGVRMDIEGFFREMTPPSYNPLYYIPGQQVVPPTKYLVESAASFEEAGVTDVESPEDVQALIDAGDKEIPAPDYYSPRYASLVERFPSMFPKPRAISYVDIGIPSGVRK